MTVKPHGRMRMYVDKGEKLKKGGGIFFCSNYFA